MTAPRLVRLRDLGDWRGGNTPSKAKSEYWVDGTVPWVSPKDMKVDEISSSEDRITHKALAEGRVTLIPEDSVLFVTRSGILAHTFPVATTKLPVTINQDLKALSPKPGISPKYVAHAVRGASQRILKECSKHGTTVASVDTGALLDFAIPLVSLDEQHRIVAEIEKQFSRLDEAIANIHRVKANLKRYKAAILKAAVEGRLVLTEAELARSEKRDYESGTSLIQQALLERRKSQTSTSSCKEPAAPRPEGLPAGWGWCSIDQLAEVGTGATPKRDQSSYYEGGSVPWVTSAAVNDAFVDQASAFVTPRALAETNLTLYPPGTLLVAMYGEGKTRGKCSELRIEATTNQAVAAIRTADRLRPYLKIFLHHNYEALRRVASGGVQPNLNLSLVRAVCVPLPPLAEQHRIVAEVDRRLSIVREVEAEVDANLKRAQALRQAVLTKAFTPPADHAPA